jgi:hypothetical protein
MMGETANGRRWLQELVDGSAAGQNEIAEREGCSRPPFPAKIALYPATTAPERVCFKRLNRETGNRLKQLRVDAGTEVIVFPGLQPGHAFGRS